MVTMSLNNRDIPRPSTDSFRLPSRGSSSKVVFQSIDNGIDVVWSGNIGACTSGTCSDNSTYCDAHGCGVIGGSPQTLAEFTLLKNNIDYYDVEVINGHNMAVEMTPKVNSGEYTVDNGNGNGNGNGKGYAMFNSSDPYQCGNAGGMKPMTGVGSCSWQFTPPSYEYRWVAAGGAACSSSDDNACSSGTVCGISNNVGHAARFQRTCGAQLGWWSANQVCGIDPNFGAPFYCNETAPAPNVGMTKRNM
jgi:hypothetical protein